MQEASISYAEVYECFRLCLIHKGNTIDAIRFEINAERECHQLLVELKNRTYHPSRSIVFISDKPVKREIFGAAFRDRVVDTVFAQRMTPLLEQQFIDDNYSTRVGKGTLYGLHRVEEMIRERSENYTADCYVMKLDMQSYFMSLPKERAYRKFAALIRKLYRGPDVEWMCWLLRVVIYDRPEMHCIRNSPKEAWDGLPPTKSLFNSDGHHGLPIGKVISQMTALVFMDDLDHLITESLWSNAVSYGHYMDDMVFVSRDQALLEWIRDEIVDPWAESNGVRRHPKKMYLQHYSKGLLFTGGMIMPGRTYISRRTLAACIDKIERYNRLARADGDYAARHVEEFASVMNSYLGMMRHFASFNQVCRLVKRIDSEWFKYVVVKLNYKKYKVCIRKAYKVNVRQKSRLDAELDILFKKKKK